MKFLKTNQLVTQLTTSFEKQVITISETISVKAGKTIYFTANVGYDNYEIKTVHAKTDSGDPCVVSIFDDKVNGNEIYQSLNQSIIRDIVNVPNRDTTGKKTMYIAVTNSTKNDFMVSVKIKAVNL
jgi:hypothetical protein